MKIKQFRYNFPEIGDVFSYVLYDETTGDALVVDGGAVEEILAFLKEKNLTLRYITNTHGHADHVCGNEELEGATGIPCLTSEELLKTGSFMLGNSRVEPLRTQGHSDDSVTLRCGDILITGDTLFAGTIGNCYTGDFTAYFGSLQKLLALPAATRVYPGHDLRKYAMGVAKRLTPGNPYIKEYLAKHNPDDEWTTLGEELLVNPFIRWNATDLDLVRQRLEGPKETAFDRFRLLMELH